jgi:alcohol dehydrogenase class IV
LIAVSQHVICEAGALRQIESVLRERAPRHVFLVADPVAYAASGAQATLEPLLAACQVTRFSEFEVNPKLEDVERGLELFREARADLVVAVGGGTAMDIGKLINSFVAQNAAPVDIVRGGAELGPPACPLVAVPTTAGTGSEATHFAVVYVDKTKYSVGHADMRPDVALVDPDLLAAAPPALMASAGLDALTQGIESFWSIYSTDESREYSVETITLAWQHLEAVVLEPTAEARLGMARAAHAGGAAINLTKTTAPHAISYPITSFFGVPHGHAVGLTLPSIWTFNAGVTDDDALDPRGAGFVRSALDELAALVGAQDATGGARAFSELMERIGLTRDFSALGIRSHDDLELIITNGFNPQRVNNNPRRLTEEALRSMLEELYRG